MRRESAGIETRLSFGRSLLHSRGQPDINSEPRATSLGRELGAQCVFQGPEQSFTYGVVMFLLNTVLKVAAAQGAYRRDQLAVRFKAFDGHFESGHEFFALFLNIMLKQGPQLRIQLE